MSSPEEIPGQVAETAFPELGVKNQRQEGANDKAVTGFQQRARTGQ